MARPSNQRDPSDTMANKVRNGAVVASSGERRIHGDVARIAALTRTVFYYLEMPESLYLSPAHAARRGAKRQDQLSGLLTATKGRCLAEKRAATLTLGEVAAAQPGEVGHLTVRRLPRSATAAGDQRRAPGVDRWAGGRTPHRRYGGGNPNAGRADQCCAISSRPLQVLISQLGPDDLRVLAAQAKVSQPTARRARNRRAAVVR